MAAVLAEKSNCPFLVQEWNDSFCFGYSHDAVNSTCLNKYRKTEHSGNHSHPCHCNTPTQSREAGLENSHRQLDTIFGNGIKSQCVVWRNVCIWTTSIESEFQSWLTARTTITPRDQGVWATPRLRTFRGSRDGWRTRKGCGFR